MRPGFTAVEWPYATRPLSLPALRTGLRGAAIRDRTLDVPCGAIAGRMTGSIQLAACPEPPRRRPCRHVGDRAGASPVMPAGVFGSPERHTVESAIEDTTGGIWEVPPTGQRGDARSSPRPGQRNAAAGRRQPPGPAVPRTGLDRLLPLCQSAQAAAREDAGQDSPAPELPRPGRVPAPPAVGGDGPPAAANPVVLRQLIDALADRLALEDEDGLIVSASRRLEAMFGYQPGELVGQPVESLVPAGQRAAHRDLRQAYCRDPADRPMGERARPSALICGRGSPCRVALGCFKSVLERSHVVGRLLTCFADHQRHQELADAVTGEVDARRTQPEPELPSRR